MKLRSCPWCVKPVLELRGQIEILDSYYCSPDEGPDVSTSGAWHSRCLLEADLGEPWFRARVENRLTIRDYAEIFRNSQWVVLFHPRSRSVEAFANSGQSLSLSKCQRRLRSVGGGAVHLVREADYNLELSSKTTISTVQEALLSEGTYPLPELLEAMDIHDRVLHPEAIAGAELIYDRSFRRGWTPNHVEMAMEYGVFVPTELEPFVRYGG
jgi:hypothetical protein